MTVLPSIGAAFLCAAAAMLLEFRLSLRHERVLRAQGAVLPPDPVYPIMRVAYPGLFVAMMVEGLRAPRLETGWFVAGAALFVAAKLLKAWAVASLGERWTYRLLVLPGAPLVTRGPYRVLRHPNYVAVVGELIGFALMTAAWRTGPLGVVLFGWILWRRIAAEERALGIR